MALTGVTTEGFVRETRADVKAALEAAYDGQFGRAVRKDARSVFGQVIGVQTGSFAALWELLELLVWGRDPRRATGAQLDAVCALFGVSRKAATYSTVTLTLTGDEGTVIVAGKIASASDGTSRYAVLSDATLVLATDWLPTAAVSTGAYRHTDGRIYYAITGGVTSSTAPTLTDAYPETETDGTVEWIYVGEGDSYVTADCQATESGAVGGSAYQVGTISTPVSGWSGVLNIEDAMIGSAIETDDALRVRFKASLHTAAAKANIDSIRGALLALESVEEAFVFENVEHDTNADGIPGHAIEAVVTGSATDEEIGEVLLAYTSAGIKTYGNTTVSIADSRGFAHSIQYTVPEDLDVYLAVTIEANRSTWPSEALVDTAARGSGRAKQALLDFGSTELVVGRDVDPSALIGAVFSAAIPGTLSVSVALDTSADPVATARLPVSLREVARFDSARTTVTVTYRTP